MMYRRPGVAIARRQFARNAAFRFEAFERRSMLSTTVLNADGTTLGTLEPYVPAGGVQYATPTPTPRPRGGAAGADGAAGYQITLNFTGGLTESQQAIFAAAAARWEAVITGELPDINSGGTLIDDVRINASGQAIDGVGMVLGSAGPTGLRSGSSLPFAGSMRFDTADLANLEASGRLGDVIAHEMGHVLGVGSIWNQRGLLTGSVAEGTRAFTGANALAEYKAYHGAAAAGATGVPVETDGGSGTAGAHWDDTTFAQELMTGFLTAGVNNPLSRMTAASMLDAGYQGVNVDAAEFYFRDGWNVAPSIGGLGGFANAGASTATLTLDAADDADGIAAVRFYRESDGIAGLRATANRGPAGSSTASDALVGETDGPLSATVSTAGLAPGTYTFYARVVDAWGSVSSVAQVAVSVATPSQPAAPAAPRLAASSDTGDSASDGLTFDATPTFVGTAEAASTVTLFADGAAVGTAVADAGGTYAVTASTLGDGPHAITLTATNAFGTSLASATATVRIDTVGPTAARVSYDRDVSQNLTLEFAEAVAGRLSAGEATLTNLTTGATLPVASLLVGNGGTSATLRYDTLFANGLYRLTIPATAVADAAGNAQVAIAFDFRQLNGDLNDDGAVDFADLVTLAQNYGSGGRTYSTGNADYSQDREVNFGDLVVLAQNYGASLFPSVAVNAAVADDPRSAAGARSSSLKGGRNAAAVFA